MSTNLTFGFDSLGYWVVYSLPGLLGCVVNSNVLSMRICIQPKWLKCEYPHRRTFDSVLGHGNRIVNQESGISRQFPIPRLHRRRTIKRSPSICYPSSTQPFSDVLRGRLNSTPLVWASWFRNASSNFSNGAQKTTLYHSGAVLARRRYHAPFASWQIVW